MWLATINAKMSLYEGRRDSSELLVYADFGSQPCRALIAFLRLAHIPFTLRLTSIRAREHTQLPMNFSGKLPYIEDRGFPLCETSAIVGYLCATRRVEDHWYPADAEMRARCEQYLHWHHTGTREIGRYLHYLRLPSLTGRSADPGLISLYWSSATEALSRLDSWLASNPFLLGSSLSVADLIAVCEIGQMQIVPGLLRDTLEKFSSVRGWFQRVYFIPEIRETHEVIEKIARKNELKPKI